MSPLFPLTTAALAAALAGTEVTVVAGASSHPEISLEGVSHHLNETDEDGEERFEPASLGGIMLQYRTESPHRLWGVLEAQGFGYFPEPEASQLRATAQGGIRSLNLDPLWADATGRVDLHGVPGIPEASSGRAEAVGRLGMGRGAGEGLVSLQIIDRRYPWALGRSFTAAALMAEFTLASPDERSHVTLLGGIQGNLGYRVDDGDWETQPGGQLRVGLAAGRSLSRVDLSLAYRLYVAAEGDLEEEDKALFTPIGFYADDADALSAGGFVQHRVEAAMRVYLHPLTLSAYGLARLRQAEADDAVVGYARTGHAHVQAERVMGPRWTLVGLTGVSAVALAEQGGYMDLYAWVGGRRSW